MSMSAATRRTTNTCSAKSSDRLSGTLVVAETCKNFRFIKQILNHQPYVYGNPRVPRTITRVPRAVRLFRVFVTGNVNKITILSANNRVVCNLPSTTTTVERLNQFGLGNDTA